MGQPVRGGRTDLRGLGDLRHDADDTAPALVGDDEWICSDCDARQVERRASCPSCGGVVVSRKELEDADYDPLIGRKLGNRFTIVARLGAGSMGAVYRARQEGMVREVALKVLKPERAFDSASKARFEREARATSALTSPHTVTVFDFGEDETTDQGPLLYLAMERLHGESLGQRLKRLGRLPPEQAARIAQQSLRSLAEAHDKGVVHRDLKPDNIFLHQVPTPHGVEEVVKVLDFGIAKIVQPDLKVDSLETQAGTVFGTPRYMSPEQAQSKPLDGRSDLYTIGLILFQMVTGRHVFPDEDAVVVMARHIQSLPPRPREIAPDAKIPRRLEAIILRALAKDPRRRPQTALEFHEELEAALLERPDPQETTAPGVATSQSTSMQAVTDAATSFEATIYSRRRRARFAAYVLGFGVLLVGAVGMGVALARRQPAPVVTQASATREVEKTVESAPSAIPSAATPTPSAASPTVATLSKESAPVGTASAVAKASPGGPRAKVPSVAKPPPKVETAPPEPIAAPPPPPPPPPSTKKGPYGKFD
jgi:serine/threonine-protein kinase